MSKSYVVKFDKFAKCFTIYLREWSFQGDRPDYTLLAAIPLHQICAAMEDEIGHGQKMERKKDEPRKEEPSAAVTPPECGCKICKANRKEKDKGMTQ